MPTITIRHGIALAFDVFDAFLRDPAALNFAIGMKTNGGRGRIGRAPLAFLYI
jgi:hypothetical protein